jgi:hypothetical protein
MFKKTNDFNANSRFWVLVVIVRQKGLYSSIPLPSFWRPSHLSSIFVVPVVGSFVNHLIHNKRNQVRRALLCPVTNRLFSQPVRSFAR